MISSGSSKVNHLKSIDLVIFFNVFFFIPSLQYETLKVLVVVDLFSQFFRAVQIREETEKIIAQRLIDERIVLFGHT